MLEVVKPGLFSTIQDRGRYGYKTYGVIRGGAMDQVALRLGNALLMQPPTAAIEMTALGGTFRFLKQTMITVTGGKMQLALNGQLVSMNRVIAIQPGDELVCSRIEKGMRSYLCIAGGFDVPEVLKSRSTNLGAEFGGVEGQPLKVGDTIPYKEMYATLRQDYFLRPEKFYEQGPIRMLKGLEWDRLGEEITQPFLHNKFTISIQSNRMGYRLLPQTNIKIKEPFQLQSEAVMFGTIQLPPNGHPIILMADHQTTGGYPKIAQVIKADLHRLAQMPPNSTIHFELVTITEAEQALMQLENQLCAIEMAIKQKNVLQG